MTTNEKNLEAIKNYIKKHIKLFAKDVTNEQLCDNGAIYYKNGNDGTMFDFNCNNRTCEFMVFYKTTELGLIKAYLTNEGAIEGYMWLDEGKAAAIKLQKEIITDEIGALRFAHYLEKTYDDEGRYDVIVWEEN